MPGEKRKRSKFESRAMKQPRQSQSPGSPHETTDEPSSEERETISAESITIAIFCALAYEAVAVRYTLDEEYECRLKRGGPRKYVYSYGKIAKHNVVIARPHQMGTVEAAHCATAVSQQFPNVRLALMVGIGAGIPGLPKRDIRLGDLAVSIPQDGHPGVIQYDFVMYEQGREEELMKRHPLKRILRSITKNQKFARPHKDDILFDESFFHVNKGPGCSGCEAAGSDHVLPREPRRDHQPVVHRGLIMSGNGAVKNPQDRRSLQRDQTDAICFEMEAAGIMDEIPCLIVRGICAYADTHKQDSWNYYAAAVAAAYCKALLRKVDSQEVGETRSIKEVIEDIKSLSVRIDDIHDEQRYTQDFVNDIDQNMILENLKPLEGASFDSYANQHEDFCLQNTRTDLLCQILQWSQSEGQFIFWLNGMAGTGKSTIARTVARSLQKEELLGATFFFKRGEADRGNARRFISTITMELVTKYRRLVPAVLDAIRIDPNIASKSLGEQFNKLLYQPLTTLNSEKSTVIVVVIDALDECDGENDIRVILELLFKLQEIRSVHLRVFLTSRPELPIRLGFEKEKNHQDLILHELPRPVIEHDIRVFLEQKLSEIQHEHSLPKGWPGSNNREKLVQMAVPLFIFAATLCRFIGDKDWLPNDRLEAVLQDEAATAASEMDRTYIPVLNQLLAFKNRRDSKQLLQEFQEIIGVIILLATPLSVAALAQLTSIRKEKISNRLKRFHAVIHVPEDLEAPVRIQHQSFRVFLVSTESDFHINEQETHAHIASHCLRLMNDWLKHNVCDLVRYGTQREEIEPQIIRQHLTPDVQYACRYWVHHL